MKRGECTAACTNQPAMLLHLRSCQLRQYLHLPEGVNLQERRHGCVIYLYMHFALDLLYILLIWAISQQCAVSLVGHSRDCPYCWSKVPLLHLSSGFWFKYKGRRSYPYQGHNISSKLSVHQNEIYNPALPVFLVNLAGHDTPGIGL